MWTNERRDCVSDGCRPPSTFCNTVNPASTTSNDVMQLAVRDVIEWVCVERESGMGATPYHVAKERDKWAIFVGGAGQIACDNRDVAIRIAQRAADLMRDHAPEAADEAMPLRVGG